MEGFLYVKSIPGILKIVEIICSFIGLLCVVIDSWKDDLLSAFIAGTAIAIVVSFLILILHLTGVISSTATIMSLAFYFHMAWFIYMLVVSTILFTRQWDDKYTAGASFGVITAGAYLVDALYTLTHNSPPPFSTMG